MNLKEFFRPELKKLILPIIFIIFFISVVIIIKTLANSEVLCELKNLYEKWYPSDNETLLIEKENLSNKIMKKYGHIQTIFGFSLETIKIVDPFFPNQCSYYSMNPTEEKCIFFESKENYDCMVDIDKILGGGSEGLVSYRTFTPDIILINFLFLFFTYYLISCIIIWTYNKVKKK